MDALKVYDVRKICDARLYIVDMVIAFVRALATVLMMGKVVVLYRYRAVPVALLCAQVRRSSSPAALCTRGRRPARLPSAPRAFGSARRLEARPGPAATLGYCSLPHAEGAPCRRPRVLQSPRAARSPHHPPRPRSRPCARAGSRSMNIQNRRDQTVPAIHRRGGGI